MVPGPEVVASVGVSRGMKLAHVALPVLTLTGFGACEGSPEGTTRGHVVGQVAPLPVASQSFLASGFAQASGWPAAIHLTRSMAPPRGSWRALRPDELEGSP